MDASPAARVEQAPQVRTLSEPDQLRQELVCAGGAGVTGQQGGVDHASINVGLCVLVVGGFATWVKPTCLENGQFS